MEGFVPRDTDILPDPILAVTPISATTTAPTLATEGYAVKPNTALMGCRYVNIMNRITGTGEATTYAIPYWYNDAAATWFLSAPLKFSKDADIIADTTGLLGNVYKLEVPEGCSRMMLHFAAGPSATNVQNVTITKGT
jgi:outer membrane receptor for monomeric catechols